MIMKFEFTRKRY